MKCAHQPAMVARLQVPVVAPRLAAPAARSSLLSQTVVAKAAAAAVEAAPEAVAHMRFTRGSPSKVWWLQSRQPRTLLRARPHDLAMLAAATAADSRSASNAGSRVSSSDSSRPVHGLPVCLGSWPALQAAAPVFAALPLCRCAACWTRSAAAATRKPSCCWSTCPTRWAAGCYSTETEAAWTA